MSDNNKIRSGGTKKAEEQGISTSRRNFTKASLLASPVLMTAMSKPVWATTGRRCTASVLMSGDGSIPIDWQSCRSCSPGYWSHHNSCWNTAGMESYKSTPFGTFYMGLYDETLYHEDELEALNTALSDFFPTVNGNNAFRKFARACTASHLNAMALGHLFGANIPSDAEIQSMIAEVFAPYRTNLPSEGSLKDRESIALAKMNYLESFYKDGSEECILPANGNCPEQGFSN